MRLWTTTPTTLINSAEDKKRGNHKTNALHSLFLSIVPRVDRAAHAGIRSILRMQEVPMLMMYCIVAEDEAVSLIASIVGSETKRSIACVRPRTKTNETLLFEPMTR